MKIEDRLSDVFRAVFDDGGIRIEESTTAKDIAGWDSVAHLNLIFAIEEEFGFTFSTRDLSKLQSVGDLMAVIRRRVGEE
jgi:acyl carrier protein